MKRDIAIYGIVLICVLYACMKDPMTKATVVRDCTGTYLRIETRDYHVCNVQKTDMFADDAQVSVKFKRISNCKNTGIVCKMLHENEGWVEVSSIR